MRSALFVAMVVVVTVVCSKPAVAQSLYWNELIPGGGPGGNSAAYVAKRAAIDGSGASVIGSTASGGISFYYSMAYEPIASQLYGTDPGHGRIQESNLDGSNVQTVYT